MKASEAVKGHDYDVELEDGEEQEVLCEQCLEDLRQGSSFVICGVSGEPVAAYVEPAKQCWLDDVVHYHWLDYFDQYRAGVQH